MREYETPAWFDRWPQCRLLLDLAGLAVRTGRPETLNRLQDRLQVCRTRLNSAPLLVDSTLAELTLAVSMAQWGDLAGAQRHTREASRKARGVDRLRRALLREKAHWLCSKSRALREKTRELLGVSAVLRASSHARVRPQAPPAPAEEPAVTLASIA